jgi:hypothetical protein
MDRITKIQIGFIVLGLFLIAFPFLITDYYYNYMLFLALWSIGAFFVLNGIIYRTTVKLSKKRTNEFEHRKGLPKTDSEILGIIGLIIFFSSLGLGGICAYVVRSTLLIALFLLLFAIGILLVYISNIMVREERRKERKSNVWSLKN